MLNGSFDRGPEKSLDATFKTKRYIQTQSFQRKYLTMTVFSSVTLRPISNIQYVKRDPGEDFEERILWGGLWERTFVRMETWGCLPSQFTRSTNGSGAGQGNSSAGLLREPDFVSSFCSHVWHKTEMLKWPSAGKREYGIVFGKCPRSPCSKAKNTWLVSVHRMWIMQTEPHGSLNILGLPGRTGRFSVAWTSGGLGLQSGAARGIGCSLYLRGLAARGVPWGTLWG